MPGGEITRNPQPMIETLFLPAKEFLVVKGEGGVNIGAIDRISGRSGANFLGPKLTFPGNDIMRLILEFYLNIAEFVVICYIQGKSSLADLVPFGQILKRL